MLVRLRVMIFDIVMIVISIVLTIPLLKSAKETLVVRWQQHKSAVALKNAEENAGEEMAPASAAATEVEEATDDMQGRKARKAARKQDRRGLLQGAAGAES